AWYEASSIKQSRDRIDRLGYFEDIDVSTSEVPGSPDEIDLNIDVKERPTGMLNLGVGYGTTDKVILSAGISQDNIFGSGHSLSLNVDTSKTHRAAVISHTNPYWTRDGISKSTSLYYNRTRPYRHGSSDGDYEVTAAGAGMNFGIPISEHDRIFMGVSLEHNRLTQLDRYTPAAYNDFIDEFGRNTTAAIFNVGWSKDTRDSSLAP